MFGSVFPGFGMGAGAVTAVNFFLTHSFKGAMIYMIPIDSTDLERKAFLHMNETANETLIRCKNCEGYYDSTLPQCPYCHVSTEDNLTVPPVAA